MKKWKYFCQQIALEIDMHAYKIESTIFHLEECLLGAKKVEEVWQGVHHLVAVAEEAGGLPQPARGQAHLLLSTKLLQAPPHQGHLLLGGASGDQVASLLLVGVRKDSHNLSPTMDNFTFHPSGRLSSTTQYCSSKPFRKSMLLIFLTSVKE